MTGMAAWGAAYPLRPARLPAPRRDSGENRADLCPFSRPRAKYFHEAIQVPRVPFHGAAYNESISIFNSTLYRL